MRDRSTTISKNCRPSIVIIILNCNLSALITGFRMTTIPMGSYLPTISDIQLKSDMYLFRACFMIVSCLS